MEFHFPLMYSELDWKNTNPLLPVNTGLSSDATYLEDLSCVGFHGQFILDSPLYNHAQEHL